jgi:hypothetical protein
MVVSKAFGALEPRLACSQQITIVAEKPILQNVTASSRPLYCTMPEPTITL